MTPQVRERIVRFGPRDGLAGILSTPREMPQSASHIVPHIVLINSGIVHRVGSNRLNVDIARAMAAAGYPVLRFDLSGLGDSETVSGGTSVSESAVADIKTALSFLESSRKATSFIVCGLCSGADYSLLAAFADPRIVGTMLIDPNVNKTRRSRLIHLKGRLRHGPTWAALLTLQHPLLYRPFNRFRKDGGDDVELPRQRRLPAAVPDAAKDIRASLTKVLDRGVHLMIVFTGGIYHVYNYRDQLFDLLPGFDFRRQLRLEFMPETDHSVSDAPSRTVLLRAMGEWMGKYFPASQPSRELA